MKKVDATLYLGKAAELYRQLIGSEVAILAQLRTGKTFFKGCLHMINASETAAYKCVNTALPLLLQEVGTAESEIKAARRDSETCRIRWDVRVYYSRVSSHGSTGSIVARAVTNRPASKNSF